MYTVPTDAPEADGTLQWQSTTLVVVEAIGGGETGLGWSYASGGAAAIVVHALEPAVRGVDAADIPTAARQMAVAVRNIGRPGLAQCAVAAVDVALWDLKAKLLGSSVVVLAGRARHSVPAYGSGGFCSYSIAQLETQLAGWAAQGLTMVKMKVGRDPGADAARVAAARSAIGDAPALFVDANGAYSRAQALALGHAFADHGVSWFEEPVSSDDLRGLRLLRDRGPAGMEIAAGEYGSTAFDVRRMLDADAVDVLQIDATRCGGLSGYFGAATLCESYCVPSSAHTSPTLHAHAACCTPSTRHVEFFHDHSRIEHLLMDGAIEPVDGALHPDPERPGLGVELKWSDAKEYLVWSSR